MFVVSCTELTVVIASSVLPIQDVLYPAYRSIFLPPREFASDGTITQIAALEKLYRVFERC